MQSKIEFAKNKSKNPSKDALEQIEKKCINIKCKLYKVRKNYAIFKVQNNALSVGWSIEGERIVKHEEWLISSFWT